MKVIKEKNGIPGLTASLKDEGKVIVFTNGCFDIVHAGHADYMEKAKLLGDVLIVAVNSDVSIKNIKGEKRPVIKEEYRLRLLESFSAIDYLVVFNEDTPFKMIEMIRPDVLVKGADWKDKGVVGEDFVKKYGGRVELIELLPGISTSMIIERVIELYGKK